MPVVCIHALVKWHSMECPGRSGVVYVIISDGIANN